MTNTKHFGDSHHRDPLRGPAKGIGIAVFLSAPFFLLLLWWLA